MRSTSIARTTLASIGRLCWTSLLLFGEQKLGIPHSARLKHSFSSSRYLGSFSPFGPTSFAMATGARSVFHSLVKTVPDF